MPLSATWQFRIPVLPPGNERILLFRMNPLNVLPWWAWLLCGIGILFLTRLIRWIVEDYDSTTVEIVRWIVVFAGVICIVIGIVQFVY
jgi:hypothetical protein